MTISIQVSVNGSYKVPVKVKYGNNEPKTHVISGRGLNTPFVLHISYYHGANPDNIVDVSVGPEEYDRGTDPVDVNITSKFA